MAPRQRALLALYFAVLFISVNGVLANTIGLPAVSITHLRCVVALPALLLLFNFGLRLHRLPRTDWGWLCGLGALMAIHWTAFFGAMQIAGVAVGMLTHYSYPAVVLLLEAIMDRRLPPRGHVISAAVVLLGIALIALPNWEGARLTGAAIGIVSAFAYALRNILQQRKIRRAAAGDSMLVQMSVAALLSAPWVDWPAVAALSPSGWLQVAVVGVGSTAICHSLIVYSLQYLPARVMSLISCMQPVAGIALAWVVLRERPESTVFVGGALVLGVALLESVRASRQKD